jgi:hypothetical protein
VAIPKRVAKIGSFLQWVSPGVLGVEEQISEVAFVEMKLCATVARETSSNVNGSSAHAA